MTFTICEPFHLLAQLGLKLGAAPLNKHPACWEHTIPGIRGGEWWFAINGHNKPMKCSHGPELPPYHCLLEWNGWPAGELDPSGGIMVTGGMANEDSFIAALKVALGMPS